MEVGAGPDFGCRQIEKAGAQKLAAAKILGISRPMVCQRRDSDRLPFREVGAHRRVLMADVLKLKAFEDRRRAFARTLSADTEDLEQNYAAIDGPPHRRHRAGRRKRARFHSSWS